jgi:retinoblastoma-like protein 1
VLYDHTSLLYNRHLDQILLCAVYGVCKVNSARGSLLEERQVTFRDIIACYHKQPQCREETFWTVSLEQTDPELEVTRRGDVIQFYNQVFVPEVKSRLLALKTNSSSGSGGSGNGVTTGGGNGGVVSAINHSQLRSPRRALPGNSSAPRSVYVSPMRSSAAAAAQMAHMTPRSKSLFAFVGESTHAYQSPGRDLQFINQRINDAAKAKKTNEEAGVATVAGVAAAIAPPSTSGRKSTRALAFEDGSSAPRGGGEEDARPPKAPRR